MELQATEQHGQAGALGVDAGAVNAPGESVSSADAMAGDAASLTPMMKQYLEVKAQHPGTLLMFRLGDFYELFFEDAITASELLQITLTSRAKGADRVPMCGVPHHAARRYIGRLVEAGHRVALCEQLEPPGKGIVKREVVRVVTPGMVLDEDVLQARENNFLAALNPATEGAWGAALLDASTGEFVALMPGSREVILDELARGSPRELLLPEGLTVDQQESILQSFTRRPAIALVPTDAFAPRRALAQLTSHLQVASVDGFGLKADSPSVGAAGAALRYLRETQKSDARHVDRIVVQPRGHALILDEASRSNLELLKTLKDGSRAGSLLGTIDRTVTSMGARRLARWLAAPLADVEAITTRLDAVAELFSKAALRELVTGELKNISDLERLCGKLSLSTGGPRDLKALGRSLLALPQVAAALKGVKSSLLAGLAVPLENAGLGQLAVTIEKALVDEPGLTVADGGFIRAGYHEALDEYVSLASGAKDYLLKVEQREREATGISSLKVRYNRVFGYYLEVTKANLHLVPREWIRKQTTANGERYVTEELKIYEEKVLTADEKRIALEQRLFDELRALVVAQAGALRGAADAVASIDVLASFARISAENGYSRPVVDESDVLEITAGRHPVVERFLNGDSFIANDLRLDRETQQVMVITGPNMAGKSTVMRQTALIVVMAQAGCFVPAKAARVGLCDRVFTRVGASDNLARGQSTFMVEMTETANILHHATRRSLVVLDEIGRGTSTFDGLSIAWAVAEHLHDRVGARTLFATHYHELTDLSREKPRVKNASVAVRENSGRIVFLRKLVNQAASRSYGIEVARLAGLPPETLARARELLANLEAGEFDETGRPRLARKAMAQGKGAAVAAAVGLSRAEDVNQLGLFGGVAPTPAPGAAEAAEVVQLLKNFSVETTTPLEALLAIAQWKKKLGGGPG